MEVSVKIVDLVEASELLREAAGVMLDNASMREILNDAKLQIEYLHAKFEPTGSGCSVLARIEAALAESVIPHKEPLA